MRIPVLFFLLLMMISVSAQADTIENYIRIYNEIPKMEMKADPQAQAWARSARNVLAVTSETIAETLLQANELASSQGKPLFCLPGTTQLNAATMSELIIQAYKENSSQQSDKGQMTVSQIAWLGVTKAYPCPPQNLSASLFNKSFNTQTMQHANSTR